MGDKEQGTEPGVKEKKKNGKAKDVKLKLKAETSNCDVDVVNDAEDIPKLKKSKKRKAKEVDNSTEVVDSDSSKPAVKGSSKKKAKADRHTDKANSSLVSGLPDPSEDSSLSEKAQNALSNALLRIAFPDLWKFNKASQIWLVKNFWVPNAVPEKYVPIVVGYLAGCEGGTRTKLIDDCKKHAQSPSDSEPTENSSPKGILKKDDTPRLDLSVRAAVLMKALS